MSQQCAPSQVESVSLKQLRSENEDLQRYLAAQKNVIASLERRVGRSLQCLEGHVKQMNQGLHHGTTWQESLTSVEGEVQALTDLLADTMLLQKLEAGKVDVVLESLPLDRLFTSVTRHLLEPRVNQPVRLVCEFHSPLPAVVADQELLEAVLTDLLARGLRYSDSSSPVALDVEPVGDYVHIYITAQRFAPVGNRDFATEIVLCCRRIEVQAGKVTCDQRPDGLQTVTISLGAFR
jgi:signal transduction histidine kinase